MCITCDPTCLTCNGATATNCLSCDDPNDFRVLNVDKCDCKDGYYLNVATNKCLKCHYSCLTCNGAGTQACLSCSVAALVNRIALPDAMNQCLCLSTFYDDGTNLNCVACDPTCQDCNGSGPN
jgi:proprotein convertase subtilisin/kexin type 5